MSQTQSRKNQKKKPLTNSIAGITVPSLRRLARRAGISRMQIPVYAKLRGILKDRLEEILYFSMIISNHRNGKTILLGDAVKGIYYATGNHVTYLEDTGTILGPRRR